MVFSLETLRVRRVHARQKIQSWLAAPERQLESVLPLSDKLMASVSPENRGKTHVQQYKKLKERLLLVTEDESKKNIKTDLMDCINTAIQNIDGFIQINKHTHEILKDVELIEEAEHAIVTSKKAKKEKASIMSMSMLFDGLLITLNEGV